MNIGGIEVGHGCRPFIVAELSCNHQGSFVRAFEIASQARWDAGADAVKVQIFDPERIAIRRGGSVDALCTEAPWAGRKFIDLYMEAHTPREWYSRLSKYHPCVFASVFDAEDVDYLERFGCPAYKIASREASDASLVARAASTGKPVIISTGTATDSELDCSVAAAWVESDRLALLYCVSEYPTRRESLDFGQIEILRRRYGVPVGFSDHTVGIDAAVEAVRAGACIIEKHVTLSRDDGGLDAAFSLEPHELRELVKKVKNAH